MPAFSAEFRGTDRFQIKDHLGSGTSGEVYRVYDTRLRSYVALKTLQRADPAAIYRLKNEFRALANVIHPNLAQLYELQADGDRWFFTMELVDGDDFLEYCRGEPQDAYSEEVPTTTTPDIERVRDATCQLALGLTALHRTGRLHCNIKPTNIRLTPEGRVVLLDFGLVQVLFPGLGELTAELIGTPAYMSPEQAAGQRLDEATDWYSVGVMLYEALTGRRPFYGGFLQVLQQKQVVDPGSPRELLPELPTDLSRLCVRLLARDPGKRPSGDKVLRRLGIDFDRRRRLDIGFDRRRRRPKGSFLPLAVALGSLSRSSREALFSTGSTPSQTQDGDLDLPGYAPRDPGDPSFTDALLGRERLFERLRRETGEARQRYAAAERVRPSDESPQPGDLFLLAASAGLPVEWAVLERGEGEPPSLLTVPADSNTLVGSADVAVPPGTRGPLTLRCGFGVWLDAAVFKAAKRTGVLAPEIVARARRRWQRLAAGEETGSVLERDVDAAAEYLDWCEDILARARLLVSIPVRAAGTPEEEKKHRPRFQPMLEDIEKLSPYRIETKLTGGSLGGLYLAFDQRFDRPVAIKRVPLNEGRRTRFRREMQALARLEHPAIIKLYDYLETEGSGYMVMERVEGESMDVLNQRGDIDLQLALKVTAEVADGLGEAYAKGMVAYRGLRLSNVIVTNSGHAKILDFGMALWDDEVQEESPSSLMSSESSVIELRSLTVAPEVLNGQPADHRSDLFELGSLLYEISTGQHPFAGRNLLTTWDRLINEEPVSIQQLAPEVPPELATLVEQLLAKDPKKRPQNARMVADKLRLIRSLMRTRP